MTSCQPARRGRCVVLAIDATALAEAGTIYTRFAKRRLARGRRSGPVSAQVGLTHPGTAGTDSSGPAVRRHRRPDSRRGSSRNCAPGTGPLSSPSVTEVSLPRTVPRNDPAQLRPGAGCFRGGGQTAYSAQKQFLTDRRPRLLSNLRAGFQGAASIDRKDWDPSHKSRLGHWRGAHQGQDQPRVRRLGDSRPPGAGTLTPWR